MKTLNEVIDCAEKWTENFDEGSLEKQMLFYLKMYRSDSRQWEADRKAYEDNRKQKLAECEAARDKYIARLKELEIGTLNDPLTWDELKKMKGKPVWVEWQCGTFAEHGRWAIVLRVNADVMNFATMDDTADGHNGYFGHDCKVDYGSKWQAYRKKRI